MIRISCPYCGPRDQTEFTCGGDARRDRPDPATCTDGQWSEYLFMQANPKGAHEERWCHTYGCGQWFVATRDTATNGVLLVSPLPLAEEGGPKGRERAG